MTSTILIYSAVALCLLAINTLFLYFLFRRLINEISKRSEKEQTIRVSSSQEAIAREINKVAYENRLLQEVFYNRIGRYLDQQGDFFKNLEEILLDNKHFQSLQGLMPAYQALILRNQINKLTRQVEFLLPTANRKNLFQDITSLNPYRQAGGSAGYEQLTIFTPATLPPINRTWLDFDLGEFDLLDGIESKIGKWAALAQIVFRRSFDVSLVPALQYVTFGFVDNREIFLQSGEILDENYFFFGVILHLGAKELHRVSQVLYATFTQFNSSQIINNWDQQQIVLNKVVVDTIRLKDFRLPVFVEVIENTNHCNTPQLKSGSASCKASPINHNAGFDIGILTAKHVTGNVTGGRVELNCGRRGVVFGVAPEGIDAAVIVCPDCVPVRGTKLLPIQNVAPWTPINFMCRFRGLIRSVITSCDNPLGIYNSWMFPLRIVFADHGDGGDSGTLVFDEATGRPVGIYMGMYRDSAGRAGGVAQHLFQATEILGLELYN